MNDMPDKIYAAKGLTIGGGMWFSLDTRQVEYTKTSTVEQEKIELLDRFEIIIRALGATGDFQGAFSCFQQFKDKALTAQGE